jgi:hypothetical protein
MCILFQRANLVKQFIKINFVMVFVFIKLNAWMVVHLEFLINYLAEYENQLI